MPAIKKARRPLAAARMGAEDFAAFKALFASAALALTEGQLKRLWQLHTLLTARNEALDLTRVKGFVNQVYKHYIDCVCAGELLSPPEGPLLDLGSGAGFPGLPLAVMKPEWELVLAEPRGRRLSFMEEAAELLELENVRFYPHKVGPRFNLPIASLITRDFEPAGATLARALQIVPPGGQVILMKGPGVQTELAEARQGAAWKSFKLLDDHRYKLEGSPFRRRLLVFARHAEAVWPIREADDFYSRFKVAEVASPQNSRYKTWLKILDGRGVKKHGLAIMSGAKAVSEMLRLFPGQVKAVVAGRPADLNRLPLSPPAGTEVFLLRPELFRPLDIFNTGAPLLLVEPPVVKPWTGVLGNGATLFIPFQDPANVGAVIRSGAAMGARVVLLKEAAAPGHPKSLRASGPSAFQADLSEGPGLKELTAYADLLWALDPRGKNIMDFNFPEKFGLVAGLEGPGLKGQWPPERTLAIPMTQGVESLNAAASAAMSLFAWRLALRKS